MAVPGRRNGPAENDDHEDNNAIFEEEDNALFEEDGVNVDLDSDTPPHLRDLAAAAQLGDVDALLLALDNLNGSIDEPLEDGDTALHLACLYGHLPCVRLLLERGANLEARDEDGAIPLHDACAGGFYEVVQLLIWSANQGGRLKSMLETVDAEGDTPLHHAARGEHVNVIQLLMSCGASAIKTNLYGKTPGELVDPDSEVRAALQLPANAETSK